jgi:hypothetical protein
VVRVRHDVTQERFLSALAPLRLGQRHRELLLRQVQDADLLQPHAWRGSGAAGVHRVRPGREGLLMPMPMEDPLDQVKPRRHDPLPRCPFCKTEDVVSGPYKPGGMFHPAHFGPCPVRSPDGVICDCLLGLGVVGLEHNFPQTTTL